MILLKILMPYYIGANQINKQSLRLHLKSVGTLLLFAVVLIGGLLGFGKDNRLGNVLSSRSAKPGYVKVEKVVDGDTVDVSIEGKTTRVRLIGINSPESVDPRKPVECFGIEASNKAKELLSGKFVKLEIDDRQQNIDRYGRLLRYVYLEDGTNFNKEMVELGFANEYTYQTSYKYQGEFKEAEADAKINKRGLWADNACR